MLPSMGYRVVYIRGETVIGPAAARGVISRGVRILVTSLDQSGFLTP